MPPIVFHEDYRGPRWTYGMVNRPAGYATVPDGRIVGADDNAAAPDPRVRHGTIQYTRPLTPQEIYKYELLPIDEHLAEYAELSLGEIWALLRALDAAAS